MRWTFACLSSGRAVARFGQRQVGQLVVALPEHLVCPAGHQREVRGRLAEGPAFVEHPLERPPGQADEGRRHRTALEPEVHRHDRRGRAGRFARDQVTERALFAAPEHARQTEPGHRQDDRRGANRGAPRVHVADAVPGDHDASQGVELDLAAARFEVRLRRFAEHLVQGPRGYAKRGVERVLAEDLAQNPHEQLGLGLFGRLVERRDGQRLPQQRDEPGRLAIPDQPRRPPSRRAIPAPGRHA